METAATWRLFVAIELGAEARAALVRAQDRCRCAGLPVRWVAADGAHLTLKFLGEVALSRIPALRAALDGVAATRTPSLAWTGEPGAFPHTRRPRVLWLGVTGATATTYLAALHRDLDAALNWLGFSRDERPYHPHLTLGRVREGTTGPLPGLDDAFAALRGAPPAPLPLEAVCLMRSELGSHGPRYTTIARARFGAAPANGAPPGATP